MTILYYSGHYGGYSLEDFKHLLKVIQNLKGRFLLTSYPSEILNEYAEKNGWFQIKFEMHKSASHKEGERKTEVFTMNYEPTEEMLQELQK